MNLIDLLLILILLLGAAYGWWRGLALGLLDVIGWVAGLLIGLRLYEPAAIWLASRAPWPAVWDRPVAFLTIAMLANVGIEVAGYALVRQLPGAVHRRPMNRLLGALPGLLNGAVVATIAATALLALPSASLRAATQESAVAGQLTGYAARVDTAFEPVFGDALAQTLPMGEPDSEQGAALPFTVADPQPRPDLEAQMLDLVNQERAQAGLSPLRPDAALTEVARAHSADMLRRGYFAHITPDGVGPFDRIKGAGIAFQTAGENLALAPTLQRAHSGLMQSPGHRANILRPEFGRVGIGIMDGGVRGVMVTQLFRD